MTTPVRLSLLLLALTALPLSAATGAASVHAILITATKDKAPADPRLAPYEATLQENLPESSFRFGGEGRISVSGDKSSSISLAGGHRIELQGGNRDADGILIKVRWLSGKSVVMNNSFTFQTGVPIVLGKRAGGDGNVTLVLLIAK